jgi:hypothetical protein
LILCARRLAKCTLHFDEETGKHNIIGGGWLDVVIEGHQYAIYIPLGKSLYMLRPGAACQHGSGDYNVIDNNTLMMVRRRGKDREG